MWCDKLIQTIAASIKEDISPMKLLKWFLDYLFSILCETSKKLHKLFDLMNMINPNIRFTMKHTTSEHEDEQDRCDCPPTQSIPFLDTSLSIQNGQIEEDLYRKPSEWNQYLVTNSCNPPDCFKSIPNSL